MWGITKRRFWIAALVATVSLPTAYCVRGKIRFTINQRKVKAAQLKYSEVLKPGTSRRDVEHYLKAQGTAFGQRWPGADVHSKAFAILVKVADEDVPWYCSAWPDYIAIEFAPTKPAQTSFLRSQADSDMVTQILVTSNGEGCL
jgi:hypothetical protein